jgi:hypothetical protein
MCGVVPLTSQERETGNVRDCTPHVSGKRKKKPCGVVPRPAPWTGQVLLVLMELLLAHANTPSISMAKVATAYIGKELDTES